RILSACLLLTFTRTLCHPDLHSFPTRRSSDLLGRVVEGAYLCRFVEQVPHPVGKAPHREGAGTFVTVVVGGEPQTPVLALVKQPGLEGGLLLLLPRLGLPTALVVGAFQEVDVLVGLDEFDAFGDNLLV